VDVARTPSVVQRWVVRHRVAVGVSVLVLIGGTTTAEVAFAVRWQSGAAVLTAVVGAGLLAGWGLMVRWCVAAVDRYDALAAGKAAPRSRPSHER
jgi:hypothetical protein